MVLALEAGELETLSPIRLRFTGTLLDLTTSRDDQDVLHTETQEVHGRIINTTVGLGGLIDVASKIGIPYHDNDFGVTLGVAGVAEGSYLVLPFFGPKPPRDLLGSFADGAFDPMTYARFDGRGTFLTVRSTFNILDTEARNLDQVETIERTSIDFYASARSLYRQHRAAQIRGDQPDDLQLLPNF